MKHFEKIFERSLTIRGFVVYQGEEGQKVLSHFQEDVVTLLQAGKLHLREHRFDGLQSAEKALRAVHTGDNLGKAVIIVDEEGGRA